MRSTAGSTQPRIARVLLVCVAGCAATSAHLLPLKHVEGEQVAPSPAALEIVTASTTVPEPLRVQGAPVAFIELAPALREAVALEVDGSFQQWRLSLELTQAEAEYSSGRLIVQMTARATLRTRADNAYVAQSQHVCSASSVVPSEAGAKVAQKCLFELARNTKSWLQRIKSNEVKP